MPRIKIVFVAPLPVPRTLLAEAARGAFATAELAEFASLEAAQDAPRDGALEFLVVDSASLPPPEDSRWAVIALGGDSLLLAPGGPSVTLTVPVLAWVFRDAAERHALRLENSRLRGDAQTVARRISHDLRSPLGCIRTSADVLTEISDGDGETRVGMAESIRQSSDEIAQLIDRTRFLLLASSESATPVAVEMGGIVARMVRQLDRDLAESGAILSLPDTWPAVRGVASWLEVVWANLLGNALRHGGAAPKIRVSWSAVPGGFRFSVADGGPGVAPARLRGLFSPFEGLHALRSPGLGLAIVRRLVELQRGTCGHTSPAAGGAEFHFTLPAPT